MAKSKYQQELEDFKKNLPEIILRHAEDNDIHLCAEGLENLFSELGVEWEPERTRHYINISGYINLVEGTNSYGDREPTDKCHDEMSAFERDINGFIKSKKYPFWDDSCYLSIDEYYT